MSTLAANQSGAEPAPRAAGAREASPLDTVAVGLRVFIVSLTMLFGGLLYAYFVARTGRWDHDVKSAAGVGHIAVPVWFWFSTFVILVSSLMLYGALRTACIARAAASAKWLQSAALLGFVFLALQVPGFAQLIARHRALAAGHVYIYGIIIVIAALHALHVLGGLVPLTRLAARAAGFADPARLERAVRHMGTYWHFLAIVWWAIFTVIVLAG